MERRVATAVIVALIPLAVLTMLALPVWAPPETYSASSNPKYSMEANSGTTLQLIVNSTSTFTTYTFTWRVTDPTGTTTTVSKSTSSFSFTSIVQSVVYPRDFTGASTNYVGNYTVRVDQTAPSSVTNVAIAKFEIGLVIAKVVMRTYQVSLKAQGYMNGENVTVDIRHSGISLAGFPSFSISNTTQGIVSIVWRPLASAPLGVSTVSFRGSSTLKVPADTQVFNIVPSNLTIAGLQVVPGILQRTQSFEIRFSSTYGSGVIVQNGSSVVRIVETDGTTHFVVASYDPVLGMFRTAYRVGLSGSRGTWTVFVDRNSTDDSYGNVGPSAASSVQVAVQQAVLSISISPLSQSYDSGNGMGFFATITDPDGSLFSAGTITVTLSIDGAQVGNQIVLSYVSAQGYWTGLYTIGQNDPSGQWTVLVDASDAYGNHGQATVSTNVRAANSSSPGVPPLLSLPLFLFLIVAAALGSLTGITYLWKNSGGPEDGLPFDTLFQLTGGEIPEKSVVLILARKDEDATALCLQLANRYLANGYMCGLLAYGSSPADLVGKAKKYGWTPGPFIEKGSLEVLDCFNSDGQYRVVKNPLDFSEVGVNVGEMLEKAAAIGPSAIVVDSLTNTFKKSPQRKVLGFLSFLAEKVKSEKGILFLAVEKSAVPPEALKALEGMADGIIELGGGEGGKRTLEVQKTFGRQVKPPPVEYNVKAGRGVRFRRIFSPVK